ncbi:unnamed protein product [Gadus morhua 'NCC']
MKALTGLLLLVFGHGVSSVLHSLHYFYTASSGLSAFPEFVSVGMVDGVQFDYYDSNTQRIVLKQDWMKQVTSDDGDYLERNTGNSQGSQQTFKANIGILKQRFNQTGGAHMFQWMFGYNRLSPPNGNGMGTELIMNTGKTYQTKECVDWLKKHLSYGKSTLQRTERPGVSLRQRRPLSSPVVCHATGFYPDRVGGVLGEETAQEAPLSQVDPGEVLPNHDGTFQVSVDFNLKAVPQEDWGRYECVVQLKGIEDISTRLDPALIRTNGEDQSGLTIPIIIGLLVLLLAAAAAVVGVLLYKKRNASDKRHKPVGSDTSSENTEGQNPAPEAQPLTTA